MTQPYPPIIPTVDEKSVSGKWPAYLTAFLVVFGNTLIWIGLLFYLNDELGASKTQIGLCMSASMGAYAVGILFLTKLLKKIHPRKQVLGALTFIMFSASMVTVFKSVWYVLAIQILTGLALTFHWSPLMGWLTHGIEGKQLNRTISKFNLSWSAGGILGPYFAGLLSKYNVYYPLYLGPLFLVAAWLVIDIAGKMDAPENSTEPEGENSPAGKETNLRYSAWVGIFSAFIILGILVSVFPQYARGVLEMEKDEVGLFLFQRSLVMTFTFVFLGVTAFWHYRGIQIVSGQILLGLSIIGLCCTGDYVEILICMSAAGVATGMAYSNSLFHGVTGSESRTTRAAIHEILLAFGFLIGSTGGGFLYEKISMYFVFYMGLILLAVSIVIQLVLMFILKDPELQKAQNISE